MLVMNSAIFLVLISFSYVMSTTNRQCLPDNVDFATKVEKSSVVVYGRTMAKIMDEGSDSTFHVFYQVDCILKGPATLRSINITNAGRAENKTYCQEFPVGRGYSIAFLEPVSTNNTDHKTYVPTDFTEVHEEGNSTLSLLARTCNLHRFVPRQSLGTISELCPLVATDPSCMEVNGSTTVIMTTGITANATHAVPNETTTGSRNQNELDHHDHSHHSHPIHTPQQEIEAIRSKTGVKQVDVDQGNNAQSMKLNIFLTIFALLFSLY